MNTAANEEYWSAPGRDRRRSRRRQAEDLHTCAFHNTNCERLEALETKIVGKWAFNLVIGIVFTCMAGIGALNLYMFTSINNKIDKIEFKLEEHSKATK